MFVFRKNGFICKVEHDGIESMDLFYERGWYIAGKKPKNNEEYEKYVTLSKIWINSKYFGCVYPKNVMDEL